MKALEQIAQKLNQTPSPKDISLYLKLFKKCLACSHSDGSGLWLEDVEQITKIVSSEAQHLKQSMLKKFN